MFDVGFTELLLIGIVALVVIGPERLPAVAKTAGHWIAKLQRFVKGVKTDLASELETGDLKKLIGDQREQIDELRSMVTTAKKDFQSTAQSVVKSTREGLSELETSVDEAKSDVRQLNDSVDAGTEAESIKADGLNAIEDAVEPNAATSSTTERSSSEQHSATTRTGTSDRDTQ